MSDNITEEEIWQCYVLFMSIPNETWTDVLKLLSRRILVQKISPLCKRLKNICNRNVDNVHVITEADRFNAKLKRGDPEAEQQLEHLAGNSCQLASQFRLTQIRMIPENTAILRNCIELFRGCRLKFVPNYEYGHNAALIGECLTHLEAAEPFAIDILLDQQLLFNQFLRHPTIWNCNRIKLQMPFCCPGDPMLIALTILDWLHHQQPIEVDGGNDGAGAEQEEEEVRCSIIKCNDKMVPETIDWLINACIQNLQQDQGPKDRRRFVLSFSIWESDCNKVALLNQFERHHNQATGEVLLLERDPDADNQLAKVYRLRRCLAEEAANVNEFYEKTFKRNGASDELFVNDGDGPLVLMGQYWKFD